MNFELTQFITVMSSQAGTRHFSSDVSPIATYEEVKNLPKNPQVLLIDVREPQELKDTGIVPTSINIPLGQVKDKLSSEFSNEEFKKLFHREKPSSTTELIFMCKIGVRSQKAADLAKTLGYEKSRNFLGSWTEWSEREGLVKN